MQKAIKSIETVFHEYCEEVGYDTNQPYVYSWMAKEILIWRQTGVLEVGEATFIKQFAERLHEAGYPWSSCLPIAEAHVNEYALRKISA